MSIWSDLSHRVDRVFRSVAGIPEISDVLPPPVKPHYRIQQQVKRSKPIQKGIGWKDLDRTGWEDPVFNLTEIEQAIRSESYLRLAIDRHREHTLRHGWAYIGKNPKSVAYINKRMVEMSDAMRKPIEIELQQAITNLIKFSTWFLTWTRDSSRKYTSRGGLRLGRVTGLWSLNPTYMRFRRDETNTILNWYQVVDGHESDPISIDDIVCGTFDRTDGFVFGTPYLLPVLDDVMAWRRFEEVSDRLVRKFAFPFYHHKIGTPETGPEEFDDGSSEMDDAEVAIAGMATDGHLITSARHEVVVLGAKDTAIDMKPILEYWENRVIAGAGVTQLDLGRGNTANRNTGQILSQGAVQRCGEFQSSFATFFNFYILDELLLEGGFTLEPENRVYLHFPPIDQEAKRSEETHMVDMFAKNAITATEMRTEIGREPMTAAQFKDTYFELFAKPEALIKAIDESYTNPGSGSKAIATKSRPENQYGRKPTKTRITKDTLLDILDTAVIDTERAKLCIMQIMEDAVSEYNQQFGTSVYLGSNILNGFMEDCFKPAVTRMLELDSVDAYTELLITAAYNYAYARSGQIASDKSFVKWKITDAACEHCRRLPSFKIRRFTLGQVVPLHSMCVDGLEFL